tara:strand:- start:2784 stop:3158 length:375 start_codon:yes stop_codon:yes gene_type:complete
MTVQVEQKLDDGFKTIVGVKGFKNEVSQKVVDTPKLLNATSESVISVANLYYDVIGNGQVKIFIDDEELISFTGVGNYGLKPEELDLKKSTEGGNNDVFVTSDVNVDTFSVALECHKETGFKNG